MLDRLKGSKWALVGLAVVSCCVLGQIAKPSTTAVKESAPTAAPALPTFTAVPEPTATEKPAPTDVPADSCFDEVSAWATDVTPVMQAVQEAMRQGTAGDYLGYGKSVEIAMRTYLTVPEPTCDPDVVEIHDQMSLVLQNMASVFIDINDGKTDSALAKLEAALQLIKEMNVTLDTVLARYK